MFNLNDPRWGRGDDNKSDEGARPEDRPASNQPSGNRGGDQRPNNNPNGQPPDLDELWRDLNRKRGGLFECQPAAFACPASHGDRAGFCARCGARESGADDFGG